MLNRQQLYGRIITAASHRPQISRILCGTVGSQGEINNGKNNKPHAENDGGHNFRRAAHLSGGEESRHRIRSTDIVIRPNSNSSFKDDNLHKLQDTFNRRGNEQFKYKSYKSNKTTGNTANKQLYHKLIKCKTIEDTLALVHDHIDITSPRTTAAVWKHLSLLLSKHHPHKKSLHVEDKQMRDQFHSLVAHTWKQIDRCNPVVLTNITHALASIIKTTLLQSTNKKQTDHSTQLFQDLLIDNNTGIWHKILDRYLKMEESFGARQVATMAWSFATVLEPIRRSENIPPPFAFNIAPFFNSSHRTLQLKRNEFTTKHISNLAWSCMTCRHRMPEFFNSLADEFISRTGNNTNEAEISDAVTLCQLANSFAKARHNDEKLFRAIAREVLSLLQDFNGRQLANLIQPFAFAKVVPKLGEDGRVLFDEVAKVATHRAKSLDPQNMANILWAYATTEQSHPELFNAIAQEAAPRLKEFSSKQLANLAWALSKNPPTKSKSDIFDRIGSEVVRRGLDSFTNQGLTMLAHSFATVGHTSHNEFWDVIEDTAIGRAFQFGHLECVQTAWAFATIERPSAELFRRIERCATLNIKAFNSQGLSNLSWAFSVLGHDSLPLFKAIADSSMRKINEFKPKERAMIVLSFSRIGHAFPNLFDKVASRSVPELNSFSSLDLFNMVVSYSKADESKHNKKLMKAIAEEIVTRPSSLSPKMLVGVAWSYANEGFREPKLFNFISKECLSYCDSFDSQEVASLAWSFVSVGCRDRMLLQTLAEKSENKWQEFGAQPLANMAWAYATADENQPSLFEGIAESAITKAEDFTSQGVANLLWAFATAGCPDRLLFQSLATQASGTLHEACDQSLANIAWAYSIANVEDKFLFSEEFINICLEKQHDFDYQGLRQLHQWNLWRQEIKSDLTLPRDFGKRCYDAFKKQTLIMSDLQRDVSSVLTSLGLNPDEEVQTRSGYILDATFIHDGQVVGVEVDGPHHFVGRKEKGNTILKARQVANIDRIPIISVPYWEWIDLHNLEDKESYIREKIINQKK